MPRLLRDTVCVDECNLRTSLIWMLLLLLFLTFSALVANPKKLLYTVANPARGLLNRGKKKKKTSGSPSPPPPPPGRCSFGEKKKKEKITRRIQMSRRYASRRYAGGLGPSRIRTRIPTTRQLGQWVSLRKTLRFRVRLQLSQSRCLSLLLAMSGRVFLFLPPRGHEPPPTLRDRLNPNLSLYRHRFPYHFDLEQACANFKHMRTISCACLSNVVVYPVR